MEFPPDVFNEIMSFMPSPYKKPLHLNVMKQVICDGDRVYHNNKDFLTHHDAFGERYDMGFRTHNPIQYMPSFNRLHYHL